MVNTCVVPGCNFSYSRRKTQRKEHVSMHTFPKGKDLRDAWVKAVRRKNWSPTNASGVCSQHFREQDMDLTGQTRRLREGAVPSVFPSHRPRFQNKLTSGQPPAREDVGEKTLKVCCNSSSNCDVQDIADLSPGERNLMEELWERNTELRRAKKKIKVLQQTLRRSEKRIEIDKELIAVLLKDKGIDENSTGILKNLYQQMLIVS